MKVIIHTHGMTLNPEQEAYVNQKMLKISDLAKRLKDDSSEINVEVNHDNTKSIEDAITCKVHIKVPRAHLDASATGSQVNEAVDKAKKKLIPQIEKYKATFG